uniref:Uncharacterized protein n=1 Tax=Strongyloides papillosus TaxID=174720 RepID=A0A0N5BSD3_STREA
MSVNDYLCLEDKNDISGRTKSVSSSEYNSESFVDNYAEDFGHLYQLLNSKIITREKKFERMVDNLEIMFEEKMDLVLKRLKKLENKLSENTCLRCQNLNHMVPIKQKMISSESNLLVESMKFMKI